MARSVVRHHRFPCHARCALPNQAVITTTECTGKLFSAGRRCKSCSAIVFPSPGEITQLDSGVRGFNDRTAMLMRSGHSIFFQPSNQNDLSTYILPFHTDTTTTKATCMDAPAMDYTTDIKMWNSGRYGEGGEPLLRCMTCESHHIPRASPYHCCRRLVVHWPLSRHGHGLLQPYGSPVLLPAI